MADVSAALTEPVTYFTVVVMNLRIWLPAYYMRSPVSEFMPSCVCVNVSVCVRERESRVAASLQDFSQIFTVIVSVCTECAARLLESI